MNFVSRYIWLKGVVGWVALELLGDIALPRELVEMILKG